MPKILLKDFSNECGVKFGTSGIRAKLVELSDKVVYIFTLGYISFLKSKYKDEEFEKILIAGDFRPSTKHIKDVVMMTLVTKKVNFLDLGTLPTPVLTYNALKLKLPSIMITGSHIPDDRNGIKFICPDGELMKEDEATFFSQEVHYDENYLLDIPKNLSNDFKNLREEFIKEYILRYTSFFKKDFLKGKKIGVYGHSAVGRDILFDLIKIFGAEVIKLGYSDKFIAVDTEAIRKEDEELAVKWVKEYNLDAIVTTDGDSDRPMVADEKGEWFKGDVLGILVAKFLKLDGVATPISSNTGVFNSGFKKVVSTKIGSPYVIKAMRELSSEYSKVGAYEANGGFLLGSVLENEVGKLTKLETRDSILPILSILNLSVDNKLKLSELYTLIPKRYTYSSKIENFESWRWDDIIDEFQYDPGVLSSKVDEIVNSDFKEDIELDGLRIVYENGDIVHFRTSGNANELRIYTESNDKAKARVINEKINEAMTNSFLKH